MTTKLFDPMIRELAQYVRNRLKVVDELSSIQFSVDVSGRPLCITFQGEIEGDTV